jgi:phosphoribosylamine--glycine ligase
VSTRVLVVGGGGREHTLAWGLARSPLVDEIVSAPGNPGMATLGDCVPVDPTDGAAVCALADRVDADLVVVGPEDPLVAGVVDAVTEGGRLAFGPRAAAARLEGSKKWMKDVLASAGVPTA